MNQLFKSIPRTTSVMLRRPVAIASFSTTLKDKAKGDEKQFFNKQDAKLLADLLKKVSNQSDTAPEAESIQKSEKEL